MLIDDFTIEFLRADRVRLAWTGTAGLDAWVFLNGRAYDGPIEFGAVTARSVEVDVGTAFRVEIHETPVGVSAQADAWQLEQFPVLRWTRSASATRYRIYRKRNQSAAEQAILDLSQVPGAHYYEHRTLLSQRQNGGQWNFYRVEARDEYNRAADLGSFPHRVPGLPAPVRSIEVTGPYDNLVLTLQP